MVRGDHGFDPGWDVTKSVEWWKVSLFSRKKHSNVLLNDIPTEIRSRAKFKIVLPVICSCGCKGGGWFVTLFKSLL